MRRFFGQMLHPTLIALITDHPLLLALVRVVIHRVEKLVTGCSEAGAELLLQFAWPLLSLLSELLLERSNSSLRVRRTSDGGACTVSSVYGAIVHADALGGMRQMLSMYHRLYSRSLKSEAGRQIPVIIDMFTQLHLMARDPCASLDIVAEALVCDIELSMQASATAHFDSVLTDCGAGSASSMLTIDGLINVLEACDELGRREQYEFAPLFQVELCGAKVSPAVALDVWWPKVINIATKTFGRTLAISLPVTKAIHRLIDLRVRARSHTWRSLRRTRQIGPSRIPTCCR